MFLGPPKMWHYSKAMLIALPELSRILVHWEGEQTAVWHAKVNVLTPCLNFAIDVLQTLNGRFTTTGTEELV